MFRYMMVQLNNAPVSYAMIIQLWNLAAVATFLMALMWWAAKLVGKFIGIEI